MTDNATAESPESLATHFNVINAALRQRMNAMRAIMVRVEDVIKQPAHCSGGDCCMDGKGGACG